MDLRYGWFSETDGGCHISGDLAAAGDLAEAGEADLEGGDHITGDRRGDRLT